MCVRKLSDLQKAHIKQLNTCMLVCVFVNITFFIPGIQYRYIKIIKEDMLCLVYLILLAVLLSTFEMKGERLEVQL